MTSAPVESRSRIDPRAVWLGVGLALVALPIFGTKYVPATDLPQHLAQVRLMDEWFGLVPTTVDLSVLKLQPLAANTLMYWPLWLLTRVLPADAAGRVFVFLLLSACAVTFHHLARARGRHPAAAVGASCFLFSAPLYWGFFNFLSGVPLFVLTIERLLRPAGEARSERSWWLWTAALGVGLYGTHVFWLAAALGAAPLLLRLQRVPSRVLWTRMSAFLPAIVATAAWYPSLARQRALVPVNLAAVYLVPFGERLSFNWLSQTVFGGMRGPWEAAATAAFLVTALLAWVFGHRRGVPVDRSLCAVGLLLLAFGFLAPDQYMNTILTNRRFMPFAAGFLLLAMPVTALRGLVSSMAATAALFGIVTSIVWSIFNTDELTGLDEALARRPPPRSIMGVDLRQSSTMLHDRPFLQLFAYYQVAHGGELYFSFTEHGSSLVANSTARKRAWTHGIEWFPERLTARDLQAFECILVNAEPEQHAEFSAKWGLRSTGQGLFRVYCH